MTVPFASHAEAALLRVCARRRAQSADHQLSFDSGGVPLDWDRLLALAARHGVTELLLAPFQSGAVNVPAGVVDRLTKRHVEVTGLNLERTIQLVELLALLRDHGIRALAFKGPTLAAGVYGHLGRRESNDLDILVDRVHIGHVRALMIADGYLQPPRRRRRGGSLLLGLYPGAGRDETLWPGHRARVAVDVHVAFSHWTLGMHLNTGDLLDRAVAVAIAGHRVTTLSPEDLFLVLTIHGMMHGWSALRHVSDIDAVTERVGDWDAVVSGATSGRLRRPLWVAVLLARRLLGTEFPRSIVETAERDQTAHAIVESAAGRMFDPRLTGPSDMGIRDQWFLPFHERSIDRLRFHSRALAYEWVLKWPWDEWLGRRHHSRDGSR